MSCKVRGETVQGNYIWYLLPATLNEWVSARYVENVGQAPDWCGSDARYSGRTTTNLVKRDGPTTKANRTGIVAGGSRVTIICKLPGQRVDGNSFWYYLTDGRWVSARYVDNIGAAPEYCSE